MKLSGTACKVSVLVVDHTSNSTPYITTTSVHCRISFHLLVKVLSRVSSKRGRLAVWHRSIGLLKLLVVLKLLKLLLRG